MKLAQLRAGLQGVRDPARDKADEMLGIVDVQRRGQRPLEIMEAVSEPVRYKKGGGVKDCHKYAKGGSVRDEKLEKGAVERAKVRKSVAARDRDFDNVKNRTSERNIERDLKKASESAENINRNRRKAGFSERDLKVNRGIEHAEYHKQKDTKKRFAAGGAAKVRLGQATADGKPKKVKLHD